MAIRVNWRREVLYNSRGKRREKRKRGEKGAE
jgi:hypothetical protein